MQIFFSKRASIPTQQLIIAGSIIAAGIIISLAFFFSTKNAQSPTTTLPSVEEALSIGGSPVLGDATAPHTIVIFADFQCSACEAFFARIEPEIRTKFVDTGKAKVISKILTFIDGYDRYMAPLESMNAALAGECAKVQGKFWELHDVIYQTEGAESAAGKSPENSGNLTREFFIAQAKTLSMDENAFIACFDGQGGSAQIKQYELDAQAVELNSTPTVYVDGQKLQNPFDITQYENIIK